VSPLGGRCFEHSGDFRPITALLITPAHFVGSSFRVEHRDIVVIGASSGGIEAIQKIVRALPADLPASLFVVIHTAPYSPFLLPGILNRAETLLAVESQDGMTIQPGRVYVARPDHHLLIGPGHVHVVRGPRENLARPAVDPLFRSAARHYGRRVIGIILTGNLDDGSSGLLAVKRRGGVAIVQDPDEARFPSMPLSALRYVDVDHRVPLREIPGLLDRLTREPLPSTTAEEPPPLMVTETKIASRQPLDGVETMETLGTLAPYSCPECHGPLWRITDVGPLRFRCHVGHGYTAEAMQAGQTGSLEDGLWEILRLLQERISLFREMQEREGAAHSKGDWDKRVSALEADIAVVQRLIASGRAGATPAP